MTYLNGIVRIEPNHRLFEPLRNLLTLTSSVTASAIAFQSGIANPALITGVGIVNSRQFSVDIHIPSKGVMESAIKDVAPKFIELKFVRPGSLRPPSGAQKSGAIFVQLFVTVASTIFASFYEAHKDWMESKAGLTQEVAKWPVVLNFGRVVRNFISHSGRVYFKKQTSAPVSWHHLTYSPADQGRRVIGTELYYPELLILMIEMSDELDALNAPVPT
jgi:hypothetical protein